MKFRPKEYHQVGEAESLEAADEARFLDLKQAAKRTNLSTSTLRRALEEGSLPSYKPRGKVLLDRDEVDGWVKAGRTKKRDNGRGRPRGNRSQKSGSLGEKVMRRRGK